MSTIAQPLKIYVRSVAFENLEKTKESFLYSLIETSIGAPLDSSKLETDRQLLTNLEMFANFTYSVKVDSSTARVTFSATEIRSLLPIASFGRIDENFWVMAGISEVNLSGKGHKLVTYYQHYDRSSFAGHVTLNRINQSDWSVNINAIKWGTREPLFFDDGSVEYNYDNYTLGGDLIYHFDQQDRLLFGGSYFTERYRAATELVDGAPAAAITHKILLKAIYTQYRINHHFFYQDGYSLDLVAETVRSLDNYPDFYISFVEWKYFNRIFSKGNLAARLKAGLSSNHENPFAPFVLDSYVNIRGVGNRVDRGTGVLVGNFEYRQTIAEGEALALQLVGFTDIGSWRKPGGTLEDFSEVSNLELFSGVGTRMIHKKIHNAILRIDYGWDLLNGRQQGLVIGIGQYF